MNLQNSRIQIIRGIAILMVVSMHVLYWNPNLSSIVTFKNLLNPCVAIFLFLSGYLSTNITDNVKDKIYKRIRKVFIPYTLWTILYTLYMYDNTKVNPAVGG